MQPEEQRENGPIETEKSIQQSDDVDRDDDILKAENTVNQNQQGLHLYIPIPAPADTVQPSSSPAFLGQRNLQELGVPSRPQSIRSVPFEFSTGLAPTNTTRSGNPVFNLPPSAAPATRAPTLTTDYTRRTRQAVFAQGPRSASQALNFASPSRSSFTTRAQATPYSRPTPAIPCSRPTTATPNSRQTPASPYSRPTPATPNSRQTPAIPNSRQTPAIPNSRQTPATPNSRPTPASPNSRPTSARTTVYFPPGLTPAVPFAPPSQEASSLVQVLAEMRRLRNRVATLEGHVTELAILVARNALSNSTGLPQP